MFHSVCKNSFCSGKVVNEAGQWSFNCAPGWFSGCSGTCDYCVSDEMTEHCVFDATVNTTVACETIGIKKLPCGDRFEALCVPTGFGVCACVEIPDTEGEPDGTCAFLMCVPNPQGN